MATGTTLGVAAVAGPAVDGVIATYPAAGLSRRFTCRTLTTPAKACAGHPDRHGDCGGRESAACADRSGFMVIRSGGGNSMCSGTNSDNYLHYRSQVDDTLILNDWAWQGPGRHFMNDQSSAFGETQVILTLGGCLNGAGTFGIGFGYAQSRVEADYQHNKRPCENEAWTSSRGGSPTQPSPSGPSPCGGPI
jgi:hypothetical protein